VVLVSKSSWNGIAKRITNKSAMITQAVRDTDRFILGSAYEIEFDEQGRFVIPQILRNYANIRSDAVFLGLEDRVEIWDEVSWEQKEKLIQQSAVKTLENLAKENQ